MSRQDSPIYLLLMLSPPHPPRRSVAWSVFCVELSASRPVGGGAFKSCTVAEWRQGAVFPFAAHIAVGFFFFLF